MNPGFFPANSSRLENIGGVREAEAQGRPSASWSRRLKRLLDLALVGLVGPFALPVVLVAALWIKRVSPGPALYAQDREGLGGRTIKVWKLRTMCRDAEARLLEHLAACPEARQEWERHFKLEHDPRILPGVGKLLRRTSLDELPQLWNVLRGEMSFVGPRPFPRYHLEQFSAEFLSLRRSVPPGLTGLWQVSARGNGDLAVQETLDTQYIRQWSLLVDIRLIAHTVLVVLSQQGAY